MADNSISEVYEVVVDQLPTAIAGVIKYGTVLNILHYTAPFLQARLDALVGKPAGPNGVPPAEPGLKSIWNDADAEHTNKNRALVAVCRDGRALVFACLGVLKPRLGQRWNTLWQTAGFLGGSLAVPDNPLALLQQFRAYFAKHPTHEVPTLEPLAVTAAACEAAAQAIIAAQNAVSQSEADAATAHKNYLDGLAAARAALGGLRDEAAPALEDDDPRWLALSFHRPCDPSTPPVPTGLKVKVGAPGSLLLVLKWLASARATSYRVRVARASDGTFLAEIICEDCTAVLENLPAGVEVIVTVAARNVTGESRECDGVRVTVI